LGTAILEFFRENFGWFLYRHFPILEFVQPGREVCQAGGYDKINRSFFALEL
jgi:hypothetical protein